MCTANFSTRISALCLSKPFIYSPYRLAGDWVYFPIQLSLICLPNRSSRCSLWGSEPPSPRPDPCPPLPGPSARPLPCPGSITATRPRVPSVSCAPTQVWNVTMDPRRDSTSILTWLWRQQTDKSWCLPTPLCPCGPFPCLSQSTDRP
jgi:hypothetical protein